jgi:RNase H-like domain found in reverse transcriptase/Reverse transcriptase (RNA-dependent DNA polymerase)
MVMFFGLTNLPAMFQTMMNHIFRDLIDKGYVTVYMDDILIHTPDDPNLHWNIVHHVLKTLGKHDLYLKLEKCQFEATTIEYLGVVVEGNQLQMNPAKVAGILSWPRPKTVRDVHAFIGFCLFYRCWIRNFSSIVCPLNELTHKDIKWDWTDKRQQAFDTLKQGVTTAPVLCQPDFTKPFVVDMDASTYALGTVLQQKDEEGHLHPIAFMSCTFDSTQHNWDVADHELFAIVEAFCTWRAYLAGSAHKVTVHTDHRNLQYFKKPQNLNRQQA